MNIKRYEIRCLNPDIIKRSVELGRPHRHIIAALNAPSAWNKFVVQHFGAMCPNHDDYAINVQP